MVDDSLARLRQNPFYILGVAQEAPRAEVERAAQRWLGLLELDTKSARHFATPLGTVERTADLVRWAVAELRDPDRRLRHELWLLALTREDTKASFPAPDSDPLAPWPDALKTWQQRE